MSLELPRTRWSPRSKRYVDHSIQCRFSFVAGKCRIPPCPLTFFIFDGILQGSGLPAGPGGLLGAAEGLSFLAILAGLVVLVLQVTDYGYVPNAVPMDGGMCS